MKNITTYSLLILFALGLSNCKKETLEDKVFQVNKVKLYPSASSKIKEKTGIKTLKVNSKFLLLDILLFKILLHWLPQRKDRIIFA